MMLRRGSVKYFLL